MTVSAISPAIQNTAQKALTPAAKSAYDWAAHHAGRGVTHGLTSGGLYLTLEHLVPLVLFPVNPFATAILTGYHGIRSGRHFLKGLFKYIDYRNLR